MWHVISCQVVRLSAFFKYLANKAISARQLGTIARPFNKKDTLYVFCVGILFCMSFVMWRVLLCQVSWLLDLLAFHCQ